MSQTKAPTLAARIQPQGGISFHDDRYIRKGDGYEAVLHVYKYPSEIYNHWLLDVTDIPNVITTIDIGTEDVNTAKKNINRSMQEQNSRYIDARNRGERINAEQIYAQLDSMYKELNNMGEVMKLIHTRIFLYAQTRAELDKSIQELADNLSGKNYRCAVFLGETRAEWESLLTSFTEQKSYRGARTGQPILTETLAAGHPFHFTSLSDPYGTYYGETPTGGSVLFDPFHVSQSRTSFNGVVVGDSGSGKTTFLKKLMFDRAIRGDMIRGFDVKGDFTNIIYTLGGKIISLDGSDGILNPLEIFKTDEKEGISYSIHISKMNKIYRYLTKGCDANESRTFQKVLRILYERFGLANEDREVQCTGFSPDRYPVLSDLLQVIRSELYADYGARIIHPHLRRDEVQRLGNIELVIEDLIANYGHIFNGHTTIPSLADEQIVFFNIRNLASMSDEIFDAQMFSALTLFWDNLVHVGQRQKDLYDRGQLELQDVQHYMILIDEAHRIVNTNKVHSVEYLVQFERLARAFFGGLWFASQNLRDFVPEGSSSEAEGKIRTLFEMTQYKFLMKQDSNSVELIRRVFANQLTASEVTSLPKFQRGDAVLSISGDRNVTFHVNLSNEEDRLFAGGV